MHDTGHHADLETAKLEMRQLLQATDTREVRERLRKKSEEELLGRLVALILVLVVSAVIWFRGPV